MARKHFLHFGRCLILIVSMLLSVYIYGVIVLSAQDNDNFDLQKREAFVNPSVGTAINVTDTGVVLVFQTTSEALNQSFYCDIEQQDILMKVKDQVFIWYNDFHACSRHQDIIYFTSSWGTLVLAIPGILFICCLVISAQHLIWKSQFNSPLEEKNCPVDMQSWHLQLGQQATEAYAASR